MRAISNPDAPWQRHAADSLWHRVDAPINGSVPSRCHGRWEVGDQVETSEAPPLHERCNACVSTIEWDGPDPRFELGGEG